MGKKGALKRVVLDTNVLVSSLLFTGLSNRLVELWQSGGVEILASGEIVQEYTRVLAYPKFKLGAEQSLGLLRDEVLPFLCAVKVVTVLPIIKEGPSDDKFLACALAGKADAIISGDKHLLDLEGYRGIPILNVRSFLERRSVRGSG